MKRALTFGNHQDAAIGTEKRLKNPVSDHNSPEENLQQKTNDAYTVGWICAVTTEYVAAQAILDELHGRPEKVSHANQSDYTLGRIGKHNTVIAALPYGEYGTASAATVAAHMSQNFPNIKIRLMVGIGGCAPSERHDIRLGDIVVSAPGDGKSGVMQYDFGKNIQGQPFQTTRFLDQPPMVLRTAMSGLSAQYEREGHRLEETINNILEKNPRLQEKYSRPNESSDRLYRSTFVHPLNCALGCAISCGDNSLVLRSRRTQEKSSTTIHYGLIASANQLMKDAEVRDKLSSEYGIMCFEMEAGGLMNQFPCLVIRGICDYSDSHKNKEWQGYAAMTAAAYARDLINRLCPTDIGAPQGTSNVPGQPQINENISYAASVEQKHAFLESLRFDQIDARQITIKNAHAKTCRWLLHKPKYLDWLDAQKIQEHHGFLWIKGKPGTGKSTIMKFALKNAQRLMRDKVVIHFFFNARGEDLEKSTIGMYRSLLLQLLEKLPALQDTLESPRIIAQHGEEYHWNTEILTNLLDQAIQNLKESSVVCFIDALDECEENQIRDMMKFFERVGESTKAGTFRVCFSSRHYPHISIAKGLTLILEGQEGHTQDMISYINSELKIGRSVLANQIRAELQEKASGVFIWIVLVVSILNQEHDKGRIHVLRKRLQEIPGDLHKLFRDILTRDRQNTNELLLCIQWVLFTKQPLQPEQLYFAMLSDVLYEWNPNEVTALDMERFILNSSKGLTEVTKSKTPTIQFIHESVKDYLIKENGLREIWSDLGADICGESHERLKRCCLNYVDLGKTAYLKLSDSLGEAKASHQEAKEHRQLANSSFPFLEYAVKNVLHHANEAEAGGVNQTGFLETFHLVDWIKLDNFFEKYDIRRHKPNVSILYILAENNMGHLIRRYPNKLSFLKVESERYGTPIFAALATNSGESVRAFLDPYVEIEPSFRDLIDEYYRDGIEKNNLGRSFSFSSNQVLAQLTSKGAALSVAFCLALDSSNMHLDGSLCQTLLYRAVEDGHKSIVKLYLNKSANLDDRSHIIQQSLSVAIRSHNRSIVELLLENGARGDAEDKDGYVPLFTAVERRLSSIIELLLNNGANVDARDKNGRTPLSHTARNGNEAIARLLLEKGAEIDVKDNYDRTPLLHAVQNSNETVARLLLDRGAEIDVKDKYDRTPLLHAVQNSNETIARLLLDRGAEIDIKDKDNRTSLSYAVQNSNKTIARLLLEKGAEIEFKNEYDQTPLLYAVQNNNETIARLLLERGAEIDIKDKDNQTSLSYALQNGNETIARLLLERGAVVNIKDFNGITLLSYIIQQGNEAIARLLLERGAEIDIKDNNGWTPLLYAVQYGNEAITRLLLERGAVVDIKDFSGITPLSYAAQNGNEAIARLLLERGAEINLTDNEGRTPLLHAAAGYTNEATVNLLLERGAEIDIKDNEGRTPLLYAILVKTNKAIVRLLLERGAEIDVKDVWGKTPLSYAELFHSESTVILLRERGARSI